MEKTAKITACTFKKVWDNPKGGQIFYHDITLDNGDKGETGAKEKEPEKLKPGSSLTYNLESTDRGNKIKVVNAQGGFNGGGFAKKSGGNGSFAMAYAKDVVIGSWTDHSPAKLTSEDLFKIADKMYAWMEEKK